MHKGQEGNGEDDKEAGDDDDEEEEEGGELMVTAADACLERGSRTGLSVLGSRFWAAMMSMVNTRIF